MKKVKPNVNAVRRLQFDIAIDEPFQTHLPFPTERKPAHMPIDH